MYGIFYQRVQMSSVKFEWDESKNVANQHKHGVSFGKAQEAFFDINRVIKIDLDHSLPEEKRFYCFGRVDNAILTVRFTMRGHSIRIFGAGYWRKGSKLYGENN